MFILCFSFIKLNVFLTMFNRRSSFHPFDASVSLGMQVYWFVHCAITAIANDKWHNVWSQDVLPASTPLSHVVHICLLLISCHPALCAVKLTVNHSLSRSFQRMTSLFLGVAERFWIHRWIIITRIWQHSDSWVKVEEERLVCLWRRECLWWYSGVSLVFHVYLVPVMSLHFQNLSN